MKKQILSFLLGGFAFLCIGAGVATSTDILTVKPATPKSVLVKEFHQIYNIQDDVVEYIRDNVKKGYITKSVVMSEEKDWQRAIIVMEKY